MAPDDDQNLDDQKHTIDPSLTTKSEPNTKLITSPSDGPVPSSEDFRSRLKEIWLATGNEETGFLGFAEPFLRQFDDLDLFADAADWGATPSRASTPTETVSGSHQDLDLGTRTAQHIEADPGEARLIAEFQLRRISNDDDALAYVSGRIAETLERMEANDEGTLEQRVDLALVGLARFAGSRQSGQVGSALLGYLVAQEKRSANFYLTIGNLSTLAMTGGLRHESMFMMHFALQGMWREMSREASTLRTETAASIEQLTNNSATLIAQVLQERRRQRGPAEREVIGRLLRIAAAIAPAEPEQMTQAQHTVQTFLRMSLTGEEALDLVVAMDRVGLTGWREGWYEDAFLEAAAAVASLALGNEAKIAPRLFNAGISLDRAGAGPVPQIVINAMGLRWALKLGSDTLDALSAYDGSDCAVNLVGELIALLRTGEVSSEGRRVAQTAIALLAGWADQAGATIPLDLMRDFAKLTAAAASTHITPASGTQEELIGVVDGLISIFASRAGSELTDEHLPGATPVIIRAIFDDLPDWLPTVDALQMVARSRRDPVATFDDLYAPYVGPEDDPVGPGPFVPVVLDRDEWERLAVSLLKPRTSIAPLLKAFSP